MNRFKVFLFFCCIAFMLLNAHEQQRGKRVVVELAAQDEKEVVLIEIEDVLFLSPLADIQLLAYSKIESFKTIQRGTDEFKIFCENIMVKERSIMAVFLVKINEKTELPQKYGEHIHADRMD